MKLTLNWLKQYVDVPWTPEELAERLTMLGLEVEGMQRISGEFEGIVVAQVVTRDKHPNADKLSLCRVNDGAGERQIVCGAQNFKAGDKVPLILPGASLPPKAGEKEPFTIKVGKIRGVESHGMMCSPQELGLPDAVDGLLILSESARVGQPFAEYLGRASGDVVYDLEITPNRPDWNSILGIAREISALTGNPLKIPAIPNPAESAPAAADSVAVRLDAPDLCPRYTARVIRGVRVGPSPDWLRSSLEKVGIRSINNVVDATNYVMIESGQPLHAFDYHLVGADAAGRPTIVVRRAVDAEQFVTLDGQKRQLGTESLMIADPGKSIALAGVMGGQNTEIRNDTVDVLLESAWFAPANVRKTSRQLGLRTDASYRFERGADIGICDWASRRCAQIILETAGGTLASGVVDAMAGPIANREIVLRHSKVNELLGLSLKSEEMARYLIQLGLSLVESGPDSTKFGIPTWRVDIKQEVDLIEEIARLYGVDRIPSTPPRGALGSGPYDAIHDALAAVRRIIAGLGLSEAQGQTLVRKTSAELAVAAESIVVLANPLSSDMDVLRPSLIPGMLDSLKHNLSRRQGEVGLFEVGRVFLTGPNGPKEERRVVLALTGLRNPVFWSGSEREARMDVYDLKGILEEFFEQLGLKAVVFTRRTAPTNLFVESAQIALGGKQVLGEIGQISPKVARDFDLRDAVFMAELNLDLVLARRQEGRGFKPLAAFPGIRRDVALLVEESVTHDAVLAAVKQAKAANLESVELFDVFRGKNIPEGRKSVAYAFTYRHSDRTLTDAEVDSAHELLVQRITQAVQAQIRA